jgi:transposase
MADMARTYTPLSSKAAQHIQKLMKKSMSVWEYRRLQCISLRQFGMQARDAAAIVGLHRDSVLHIWSVYLNDGLEAVLGEKRGRVRSRAHLTRKKERQFLKPFLDRAEKGKLTTVRDVHKAHCKRIGKDVDPTVTYRLLDRHGWRRIVPRPQHPKANLKAQEEFRVFFPQDRDKRTGRSNPLWSPFPVDVQ